MGVCVIRDSDGNDSASYAELRPILLTDRPCIMIVFALPHENGGITWQIASKINTMSSAPLSRRGS